MEATTTKEKITEFLNLLDYREYINIRSMMKQETGKSRLIDLIFEKLLADKTRTIDDVVSEVEQSLYSF
ncbi:MAG: hypothetical protein PHX80_04600 [Candidatus Nanoarchaeia archaeon]|nr:hypothetical protein [Candidatus Nanoarchaeia archaeon]